MGIIAGRWEPFIRSQNPDDTREEPLGTRLRGRFEEIDVDSVDVTRNLRFLVGKREPSALVDAVREIRDP